jgi:nucleoid-associated protein EbfC
MSEGTVDPGGQIDMQQLLAAAQQMQDQLMNAQQELADAVVEGSAGGGLVTAKVNGQGDLVDLKISPAAIETTDPDETAQTIADLVLAAVRDANRAAADLQAEKMGPLASGIGGLGGPGAASQGPGAGPPGPGSIPPIPGVGDFPGQPHGGEPRGGDDVLG